MKLHIYDTKEKLADHLASWMAELISETLHQREFFYLALSGGETPKILFQKLASPTYRKQINWKRIHIFWGDERVVPFKDERNNAGMAYELLINQIDIPSRQVHIMPTNIEPHFAVEKYRTLLHKYFDSTPTSFDLVLLGMGNDGHTLSLFPGSPAIKDKSRWVKFVYNEQQEMYRITLMPRIVNKTAHVAFMVDGSKKAKILQEVMEGD